MGVRTHVPGSIWSTPTQPDDLRPFRLGQGTRGCLLLHGFAGTPPEVRGLGEHLASHGYSVIAPLLPGHGVTPELMARTRWTDWVAAAQGALESLRRDCSVVFVGGQSMGGSIALYLAAHNPDLHGVITMGGMASPRFFRDWRLRFIRELKYLVRWHVPADCDLGDPEALLSLHSYSRRPTVCVESLMDFLRMLDRELPMIRVPVLILHGRRDRTVPVENAPYLLERLGSRDKRLVWFERSGHAITVDLQRVEVNELVSRWVDAH